MNKPLREDTSLKCVNFAHVHVLYTYLTQVFYKMASKKQKTQIKKSPELINNTLATIGIAFTILIVVLPIVFIILVVIGLS